MSWSLFCRALPVCIVVLAISGLAEPSQAQSVPLKISGGGVLDQLPLAGPEVFSTGGVATHLGNYTGAGFAQLDMFTSATTADFSGGVVFVAADGSELHMDFVGEVTLIGDPATTFTTLWVADFTPVVGASTGRFANVNEGLLTMCAWTDEISLASQNIPYQWEGSGKINLGKKK